jgi:hypothetical protein
VRARAGGRRDSAALKVGAGGGSMWSAGGLTRESGGEGEKKGKIK